MELSPWTLAAAFHSPDAAEPEVIALFLQFDDASYLRHGVSCLFPAAPATAQIPTDLLGHLVSSPRS